jgi:hypothetical protein
LSSTLIFFFDGKTEKFAQWSYTFLSICAIAGCKEVLTDENINIPLERTMLDPAKDADLIILRKANNTAYSLLLITVKDPVGFQAIRNGKDNGHPSGLASLAWKNIVRIYKSTSTTQKFELEQNFNQLQLTQETKNPDEWFTALEHIRIQLEEDHGIIYDNDKMIQHIIYNLKVKQYETLVSMLKRDLGKKVNLDLEEIKEEIRQLYGQIKKTKKPETALAAGYFKGKCRICGKQGHKGNDCWTLDKNKNKRPKSYKVPAKKEETANSATAKQEETANSTSNTTRPAVDRSKFHCNYCDKDGHDEAHCFKN